MPEEPTREQRRRWEQVTRLVRVDTTAPRLADTILSECHLQDEGGFRLAGAFNHGNFVMLVFQRKSPEPT